MNSNIYVHFERITQSIFTLSRAPFLDFSIKSKAIFVSLVSGQGPGKHLVDLVLL